MRKKKVHQAAGGHREYNGSSVQTADGELSFYFVQPTNLNVLPEAGVRERGDGAAECVERHDGSRNAGAGFQRVLSGQSAFLPPADRAEENPAIRALLAQDRRHLDDVQTMMASSRQFCFVLRRRKTNGAINFTTVEQQLRDSGFAVRRAEGQALLELLAIYFEQDATHEVFDLVDGARWLAAEAEVCP